MKVLDLFSGIGGFSLGFERAGLETAAFCEIDPAARKVLAKHWPSIPRFTDVTELSKDTLVTAGITEIDVICGGFPCQDVSVAGNGHGLEGRRSGLWGEYKRLIEELEPTYVAIENVANLRSKGLARVLQDLWEIGYDAEWHIIPASAVGLPHTRERIWIIAYPASLCIQEPLLEGSQFIPSQPEKPRFGDGWISEWLTSWIRSVIVPGSHGLPRPLACDAVKQYGNSVVPQIPELIGRTIRRHHDRSGSCIY